jgi:hypothetical protein
VQYYISGIDLEKSITGSSKDCLDQGVWQRTLFVNDRDRDALITAQMNRDWQTIAKFMMFYLKEQGRCPHWSTHTNPDDGSIQVHFNQCGVSAAGVGMDSSLSMRAMTYGNTYRSTVFQYDGQADKYENMSAASSPITVGHLDVNV